jgi:hypothetical protein
MWRLASDKKACVLQAVWLARSVTIYGMDIYGEIKWNNAIGLVFFLLSRAMSMECTVFGVLRICSGATWKQTRKMKIHGGHSVYWMFKVLVTLYREIQYNKTKIKLHKSHQMALKYDSWREELIKMFLPFLQKWQWLQVKKTERGLGEWRWMSVLYECMWL